MTRLKLVIVGTFSLLALFAFIGVFQPAERNSNSAEDASDGRPGVKSAFNTPTDLAGAASRGTELASDFGLQNRYLIFEWQPEGHPTRGKCISVATGEIANFGPNCYRSDQIAHCNAYQSEQRVDGQYESVGFVGATTKTVGLRAAGVTRPVPVRDGVFTAITDARISACRT